MQESTTFFLWTNYIWYVHTSQHAACSTLFAAFRNIGCLQHARARVDVLIISKSNEKCIANSNSAQQVKGSTFYSDYHIVLYGAANYSQHHHTTKINCVLHLAVQSLWNGRDCCCSAVTIFRLLLFILWDGDCCYFSIHLYRTKGKRRNVMMIWFCSNLTFSVSLQSTDA